MPSSARTTKIAIWLLAAWSVAGVAYAQSAWREDFEAQQPSWRDAGGDARYKILQHQRVQGEAHSGNGCEWVKLEGEGGTRVFLARDVGHPRIIEELQPSVWIKSDRAGLQLAVRIILPRTLDPQTGQPLTTILLSGGYTQVGRWQQLRIVGIPKLLTRQVHVLRMEHGPKVDDREAYLDAVLLNVYGGRGATNVWIDDLEIAGHVGVIPGQPSVRAASVSTSEGTGDLVPVRLPPVQPAQRWIAPAPRRTVRLDRSLLLVNDWPFFPRVIQHRGEQLKELQKIGFNVVWLQRLPAPEVLEEANRLGIWLICPPPRPTASSNDSNSQGDSPIFVDHRCATVPAKIGTVPFADTNMETVSGQVSTIAEIGPQFDCVLAWDLGGDLTGADREATQRWADQVREADRRGNRPMICRPRNDLSGFSRLPALLLIDRRPIGTSFEFNKYAEWVHQQPLLASPGTPVWTMVQTQPNEALRQQLAGLDPGYAPPMTVSSEQIRLLAYTAVAAGSRGLVFASDSPLDATDPDTRQRATTLELLNLELQLMEPWAAAGSSFTPAESKKWPEVAGAVLHTDRAKLMLPIWASPGAQCVPGQSAGNAVEMIVPGVPESTETYELTPNGTRSIPRKRVAGGVKVTLDEFGMTSQILLAQDPSIIGEIRIRSAQIGRRSAALQRELAVQKLNQVQSIVRQLSSRPRLPSAPAWFDAARRNLQSCDAQLASGDVTNAALNAQRAMRSLRLIERAYWDDAVKGLRESPVTSPAALSFDTLPSHWRLMARLSSLRLGENRLAGGDFEDLDVMMRSGWRHILNSTPTVQTMVDLTPQAARSGRLGLRLAIFPVDPKKPPAAIESPPILFTSPAVQVEAGQIVCIHGWSRVPTAIGASTDGLLVVDSISGEALADRIDKTKDWKEFALYRVATQTGPVCVHFALSGLGEAWLDDVAIQVFENPGNTVFR